MIEMIETLTGEFKIPKTEYLRLNETNFKYDRLKKYITKLIKDDAYINSDKLQDFIKLIDDEIEEKKEKETNE